MALGVYIMVLLVAHFFCLFFPLRKTALWCLDNNLVNKEIFPSKFCPNARKINSPFEVRCPLSGGRWEHTHFNTRNKDTYPSRSEGIGSHVSKHSPFLTGLVPWGNKQAAAPQVIPLAHPLAATTATPSHQHTSPLEYIIFCPILGFKQDSYNWLQPPVSPACLMRSHGTAPRHLYRFRSSWARGCSSDTWSFWPDLFPCLTVREQAEVMA